MIADKIDTLTPAERLALSRRALMHALHGGELPPDPAAYATDPMDEDRPPASEVRRRANAPGVPWLSVGRHVVERWWQRHPANAVIQLARPLLDRYAAEKPAQLMAAAAAAGAAVVLVRPWRLLSVGAVLAAVLKTSDVADMVSAVMKRE